MGISIRMKTYYAYFGIVMAFVIAGCGSQVRTGGPMTCEQALVQSEIQLPVPPSAHDVYFYLVDRGSQDHDLFLRFSADFGDIQLEIAKQWEFRNNFLKRQGIAISQPIIDRVGFSKRKTWIWNVHPPAWWKPQEIRKGFYTGTEGFESQHFWVDEETNTVYFHQFF
jgi:hypothetical protein